MSDDARTLGMRDLWGLLGLLLRVSLSRQAVRIGCRFGSTLSIPAGALGVKAFADGIVAGDLRHAVVGGCVTAGASVLNDGLNWTSMALDLSLLERTGQAIDEQLMTLTAAVPGIEHHERPDYQDRILLLSRQRDTLSQLPDSLALTIALVIETACTLVLLAGLHPLLLLLPLFGIPSLLAARRAARDANDAEEDTAERRRGIDAMFDLATSVTAAKEVRVFGLRDTLTERHRTLWDTNADRLRGVERRAWLLTTAAWTFFSLGFAAAIGLVALRVTRGQATIGDLALALSLAARVNSELTWMVGTIASLQRGLRAAARYTWLRRYSDTAAAALDPGPHAEPAPSVIGRGITLSGVGFTYPGTDRPVLDGVDLFLPAGSAIAVVGDNGAGKTTLVKLLCRLYEPTSGTITIDDTPLASLSPTAWRERLSAGFQDFARPELAALEAIGIGRIDAIDDEPAVLAALTEAGGATVLHDLPNGLATQLGRSFDGGVELSGGQWQKLALGRAMMRPAPLLLVLDEPTAALDAHTEHVLFERFTAAAHRLAQATGTITLLVSHRFSTVRMADLIVVVHDGHIAEHGTHEQLITAGGIYAELYTLQAASYR